MSKKEVERLLIAGGKDKEMRSRDDQIRTMTEFVETAVAEGFDFSEGDLVEVLRESGDSFESSGNPRRRDIWWF